MSPEELARAWRRDFVFWLLYVLALPTSLTFAYGWGRWPPLLHPDGFHIFLLGLSFILAVGLLTERAHRWLEASRAIQRPPREPTGP